MMQPLLQAADLRGGARLTLEAVAGLESLVVAMRGRLKAVPRGQRLGATAGPDQGFRAATGLASRAGSGANRLAGHSAESLLAWLAPALAPAEARQPVCPEREAILAALNGVMGDHLATTGSSLAIPMQFRHAGRPLPLERQAIRANFDKVTPKVLVLLHGLCMNDLQWQRMGHDHGEALARESGYTPVYLHYNTGLSVSTNGRILAPLMEALYSVWPMPIERLVMLGHSMGGLVARSAIHHGELVSRGSLRWPGRVDDLVSLGTPHQGADLGRAGPGLDLPVNVAPYAAPLNLLGKLQSAGISDLRLGHVLTEPVDNHGEQPPRRVGLPMGTRCFAMAASHGPVPASLKSRLQGDGLVAVASALGQHEDPRLDLGFAPERQAILYRTGHLDLLSSAEAMSLLRQWLG